MVFLFTVWLNPPWKRIHTALWRNWSIELFVRNIWKFAQSRKASILIVEFQLILFIYYYVSLKAGRTFTKQSYRHLWGWDSGEIFSFPVFYNGRLTVSPCYLIRKRIRMKTKCFMIEFYNPELEAFRWAHKIWCHEFHIYWTWYSLCEVCPGI